MGLSTADIATLEELGHRRVLKTKKYFVQVDADGNVIHGLDKDGEPEEITRVDCKGRPTEPQVWIGAGANARFYEDDNKTRIKNKIKNKEPLDIEEKESK